MDNSEQLAVQLVSLWFERSVGSQESFGYVISSFLRENPLLETTKDVKAVLNNTKKMAEEMVSKYSSDIPLNLSYKAFTSALDNFIACLN